MSDNTYEARMNLYGYECLGDRLADPIPLAPGVELHQFLGGIAIVTPAGCSILPDASVLWDLPECKGDLCENCDGRGNPRRAPRGII